MAHSHQDLNKTINNNNINNDVRGDINRVSDSGFVNSRAYQILIGGNGQQQVNKAPVQVPQQQNRNDNVNEIDAKNIQRSKELAEALKKTNGVKVGRMSQQLPADNVLFGDFKNKFKESLSASRREGKIKNKKSRLFAKNVNHNSICDASEWMTRRKFNRMSRLMENRKVGCDIETFHDLSAFLVNSSGNEDVNNELLDCFLGTERNKETGEVIGQDIDKGFDMIIKLLFNIKVNDINFTNDTEMVKNAFRLENIVNCIGAYDRLLNKFTHRSITLLTKDTGKLIEKRVEELRSVANYYLARKDLLNDELFRTHYDYEMTMELKPDATEEQRNVAKKIMLSYIFGQKLKNKSNANANASENLHFQSALSNALFAQIKAEVDGEGKKEYLATFHSANDNLAAGVKLNANKLVLDGGNKDKRKYYASVVANTNTLKEIENNLERKDIDTIKNELAARNIVVNNDNGLKLYNPLTGETADSISINRLLESLKRRVTAHMGTDDIVTMLYNLFAPALEENKNNKTIEEKEKLNKNFLKGMKTLKSIFLVASRGIMNSFGNIPQQLSTKDNNKLKNHYGDILKEYTAFDQDVGSLFKLDQTNEIFTITQDSTDNELLYRQGYIHNTIACISDSSQYEANEDSEDITTQSVHNNMTGSTTIDYLFFSESFGANRFVNGPSMSKRQLKNYTELKKKEMTAHGEFENFKQRSKNLTDTDHWVWEFWKKEKITGFKNRIGQDGIKGDLVLKREISIYARLLDTLKNKPSWENPDLEKDVEVRKRIILAKENENYLKAVDRLIDLSVKKQKLGDDQLEEKNKLAQEIEDGKNSLCYVDNEYIAMARENAMKDRNDAPLEKYTERRYNDLYNQFKLIKVTDVKFSDYEDIIKNYHYNIDICKRVERFQFMLGDAILAGKQFTDDFLIEVRAKMKFFGEIHKTVMKVNEYVCSNPDSMDGEKGGVESYLTFGKNVIPTHDPKSLYNTYLNQIKNENTNKEHSINTFRQLAFTKFKLNTEIENKKLVKRIEADDFSQDELQRYKADYQKNSCLFEILNKHNEVLNRDGSRTSAVIATYCQRNALVKQEFGDYLDVQTYGKSAQNIISAYNNFTGSDEHKIIFYLNALSVFGDVSHSDYDMHNDLNMKNALSSNKLQQRIKNVLAALQCDTIINNINALLQRNGNGILPQDQEEPIDYPKKFIDYKFKAEFLRKYGKRTKALCGLGINKYAGTIYINDLETISNVDHLIETNNEIRENQPSEENTLDRGDIESLLIELKDCIPDSKYINGNQAGTVRISTDYEQIWNAEKNELNKKVEGAKK